MKPFDWQFPYPSQRMPILARNCVATSQPLAAQAGLRMLMKGGSAVDAVLATAISLTVLEPTSNGIGSDAFAILWDGKKLQGLNASGRSPAAWTPDRFKGLNAMPQRGWDSVTVPGAISAWVELSSKYGKLPFADLFEPAIDYASRGYMVSPTIARLWEKQLPELKDQPGYAEAFMPNGRAPLPGEKFIFADQARTLKRIAETKGEAFYKGDLAEKIVAHAKLHGGAMTMADLAAHQCDWVEPVGQNYRGYTLHEIPPNGQGIGALISLGILENFDMAALPVDSADSLHVQLEAMKLGFADIYEYVSDPATMRVTPAQMLDRAYLASRAKLIDMKKAQDPKFGTPPTGGTVYLTAADASGMMVSYIQSNYAGFGSGVVVNGTGISLQNRGAGFVLQPGHPNQVAGGKRPYHTIIPGFVTRDGGPYAAFGVMGGPIQPPGHVQTLVRLLDYGMNPQAVLDAPRWKVNADGSLDLEASASPELRAGLIALGHKMESVPDSYMDFGAGQFIVKADDGYVAASDSRRDGHAVGF